MQIYVFVLYILSTFFSSQFQFLATFVDLWLFTQHLFRIPKEQGGQDGNLAFVCGHSWEGTYNYKFTRPCHVYQLFSLIYSIIINVSYDLYWLGGSQQVWPNLLYLESGEGMRAWGK